MREVIGSVSNILGTTPDGQSWCLKALHPADPVLEVAGIPDDTNSNVVMLNYTSAFNMNAPAGSSDPTWNFAMQLQANPVNFGFWTLVDNPYTGTVGDFNPLLNTQLPGTSYNMKTGSFYTKAARWRVAYMSVTGTFDGPALSNQGMVAADMVPYSTRSFTYSDKFDTSGNQFAYLKIRTTHPGGVTSTEFPQYDTIVTNPNAYIGEIKEGFYVPLKLTKTHQQWHSAADMEFWVDNPASVPSADAIRIPVAAGNVSYPHPMLPSFWSNPTSKTYGGTMMPPIGNDLVAHICGKNIAVASAVSLTVRMGIEIQVENGSELTPFMHVSPSIDNLAIENYFAISRVLKDGYPSSYNDLGKLWNIIRQAAVTVAPLISMIPHPIAKAIGLSVGSIASVLPEMKRRQIDSAANVEKEREDLKAAQKRKLNIVRPSRAPRKPLPVPPRR